MVEEVDRLNAEFAIYSFGEAELLEERGVGAPIARAAQAIALLVAERAYRRDAEDTQVGEKSDGAFAVTARAGLDRALDVRAISARIRDAAPLPALCGPP